MSTGLRVAIAGAGTIGTIHANAIAGLETARLVAIADPDETAGRRLADAHAATWHADLAEALTRADVDAIVLATPSGLHAEQAILAARAGKHVITEKPMATTVAAAERMIAACERAGVALAVIFQTRFSPDVVRLRRAVQMGRFGRIVLANALVHWHRTQTYYDRGGWRGTWAMDGGGALMNQSIHTIDLLQWIAGPIAQLAAEVATLAHTIETEDTASATLRFASGALGVIQGTTAASVDWPPRLEIVGTAGRAVLEAGRLTASDPDIREDPSLLDERDRALTAEAPDAEPMVAGHRRQLRAIVAALLAGETPPVPGVEAKAAVAIIEAIYRSAREGRPIAPAAGRPG